LRSTSATTKEKMNKDQDELLKCCTCEKISEIVSVFRMISTKKGE